MDPSFYDILFLGAYSWLLWGGVWVDKMIFKLGV